MLPLALVMVVVVGTLIFLKVLPDGPEPELFIIGDSVTQMSESAIEDQFEHTPLEFVAFPGYSSTMLLPDVVDAMGAPGDPAHSRQRVAVLVGYNDVRLREVDTPSMKEMVDLTAEFDCGVWLTLPSRPGGEDNENAMALSPLVDEWNLRLQAEVERHENLHLSDAWARAVTLAPKGDVLRKDGVHPNAAGRRLLARIYRDALDEYCPKKTFGS
ncbi:MAG TPA: SGNH/GDSL hydrolase family protein [Acidimicrobiales bacterium]|nr:SGNH/GDSL hydrolase family protein [Acidimicrobiales bacterium]